MTSGLLASHPAQELRIACTVAQQEREGGVSARVSPLAQVGAAGNACLHALLLVFLGMQSKPPWSTWQGPTHCACPGATACRCAMAATC